MIAKKLGIAVTGSSDSHMPFDVGRGYTMFEGDLRTAMGMKILDLLGGGGMFVEFFAIDYNEEFLLLGHDGPCNINMSEGKPTLQNLDIH